MRKHVQKRRFSKNINIGRLSPGQACDSVNF